MGGHDQGPGGAVPGPRRGQPGHRRQQPRLAGAAERHGLPARRRQALPGQPAAGQGGRQRQAQQRAGDQLHGVQLPAAPGRRLPGALPALRLPAADRGLGPVGEHHVGCGPAAPGRADFGARHGDAAGHQGGRLEVWQVRDGHGVAGPRDDQPLRLLPVLAQQ